MQVVRRQCFQSAFPTRSEVIFHRLMFLFNNFFVSALLQTADQIRQTCTRIPLGHTPETWHIISHRSASFLLSQIWFLACLVSSCFLSRAFSYSTAKIGPITTSAASKASSVPIASTVWRSPRVPQASIFSQTMSFALQLSLCCFQLTLFEFLVTIWASLLTPVQMCVFPWFILVTHSYFNTRPAWEVAVIIGKSTTFVR